MIQPRKPARKDNRIVLHFDYDCFYASVFEHENPALKSLPLAVQQVIHTLTPLRLSTEYDRVKLKFHKKQIIVTCNYEARRRGLRKLQLIADARKTCPDVVIVLGEELGRFRDASKALYKFLESYTWSGKVERLGFDEVFMDVTDIIDYNQTLLNQNDLSNSFFQLKKGDPTIGFAYDATKIAPHVHPDVARASRYANSSTSDPLLHVRLTLGSHFAEYLRLRLDEEKGYTATVGISTNKLLSKLVGNVNKPQSQTTLLPPYVSEDESIENNVTSFIDDHEIAKIPGIGFKSSQKIHNHVLSKPPDFGMDREYDGPRMTVTVRDVRKFPGMGPEMLEKLLGGPGAERGIGGKIWALMNGIDDTEVQQMRKVPSQISIEDSYIRLVNMAQAVNQLRILTTTLVKRMHVDLLEDDEDPDANQAKRWIAHPKTLRLSTRARPPLNEDGTRVRSFARVSRSCPLPNFVFSAKETVDDVVEKLVQTTLIPLFRQIHPPQSSWNLSLMNVCVTNLVEAANDEGSSKGRDIGKMFKRQETILREWKVEDKDVPPDIPMEEKNDAVQAEPSAGSDALGNIIVCSEDALSSTQNTKYDEGKWEEDEEESEPLERCAECGASLPAFAAAAHARFHVLEQ